MQYQKAISKIINIANSETDINSFLKLSFLEILLLSSDSFKSESSFELFLENDDYMAVGEKKNNLPKKCKIDNTGKCFCENARTLKEITECKNKDNNLSGSHFCIPIRSKKELKAILVIHFTEPPSNLENEFLLTIIKLLESFINIKNNEKKLKYQTQQQNVLNQKLFAQSLELDQKNIEIKSNSVVIKEQFEEIFASEEELRQNNEELLTLIEHLNDANNIIKENNNIIEKSHKNTTASINYATTIQKALLTNKKTIDKLIKDYFILFRPKEIVSGDFYYINKIDNQLIIAIADCTGHGVPGGFLTVLGITYIHEIIKGDKSIYPNNVLNKLRVRFKKIFSSNNNNGLDIAFCILNTETKILQYAGAYNPLIIMRDNELIEYKATRNPVGSYLKEIDFKNNVIQLKNKDSIYLYSDGFQDQYGNLNIKKYSSKRFKQLLIDINKLPMKTQEEKLNEILTDWQGDNKQTDDILVFGMLVQP